MSTVHAVVRATIEVRVRASEGGETLDALMVAAQKEAQVILSHKLPQGISVVGPVEFSHAVVKQ